MTSAQHGGDRYRRRRPLLWVQNRFASRDGEFAGSSQSTNWMIALRIGWPGSTSGPVHASAVKEGLSRGALGIGFPIGYAVGVNGSTEQRKVEGAVREAALGIEGVANALALLNAERVNISGQLEGARAYNARLVEADQCGDHVFVRQRTDRELLCSIIRGSRILTFDAEPVP